MSWQQELQNIFKTIPELLAYLEISQDHPSIFYDSSFPIKVPRSFANRMLKGNIDCPLLKQVLPVQSELSEEGGVYDPLMEDEFIEDRGILQKFQHRLLVIASGHCAIHCRYCFRRHFPYDEHRFSTKDWTILFERLKADRSLNEVILSGGDPLTLPDNRLETIIHQLNTIDHLEIIRIHSRLPIVIPSRLTSELQSIIRKSKIPVVIVFHINHPQELDASLIKTLKDWQQVGCVFFNQAVLLKGVNDTVTVQENLWRTCFKAGIQAYYLHQFDDVKNAQHFKVNKDQGLEIITELRKRLPGFMMPSYVQEIPFAGSKVPIV
ncbi:KamA family radical SAM protein [bacterium]|nr:KamA family radical SAM protein [bacterium]NBW56691.1 KamA family radical SAM protein [bacterium]NBX72182.1 KamA family radical SAM protein [bacterium]